MKYLFICMFIIYTSNILAQSSNIDDVLNVDLQKANKGKKEYETKEKEKITAYQIFTLNQYINNSSSTEEGCVNYLKSLVNKHLGITDCDQHHITFEYDPNLAKDKYYFNQAFIYRNPPPKQITIFFKDITELSPLNFNENTELLLVKFDNTNQSSGIDKSTRSYLVGNFPLNNLEAVIPAMKKLIAYNLDSKIKDDYAYIKTNVSVSSIYNKSYIITEIPQSVTIDGILDIKATKEAYHDFCRKNGNHIVCYVYIEKCNNNQVKVFLYPFDNIVDTYGDYYIDSACHFSNQQISNSSGEIDADSNNPFIKLTDCMYYNILNVNNANSILDEIVSIFYKNYFVLPKYNYKYLHGDYEKKTIHTNPCETLFNGLTAPEKYMDLIKRVKANIVKGRSIFSIPKISELQWVSGNAMMIELNDFNHFTNESSSNNRSTSVSSLQTNSQTSSSGYDLSNTTKTCSWCGKTFTGKAWTVSMGEPIQWKYLGACSQKCAMESYKSQRH